MTLCWALLLLPVLAAGLTQHGQWTMTPSEAHGKVNFRLHYSRGLGHSSDHSSDWALSEFRGLDFADARQRNVHFTIEHEAGTFACEGLLKGSEGAGFFDFASHSDFSAHMAALGFSDFQDEKLMVAALFDITTDFARRIKAQSIGGMDADKLIAFRIFGVTPQFVESIRALGFTDSDADKLIAMRIHGVTPQYIESLRAHGVKNFTLDQAIALRIQGIN